MRRYKPFFFTFAMLFMGLAVWLFPKTVDPVLFLGFSEPLVLKSQKDKQTQEQGKTQNLRELASPRTLKD